MPSTLRATETRMTLDKRGSRHIAR